MKSKGEPKAQPQAAPIVRPIKYTSIHFFSRATIIWQCAVFSVPFDLIGTHFLLPFEEIEYYALFLLLAAAITLPRELLIQLAETLREKKFRAQRILFSKKKLLSLLLVVILIIEFLIKFRGAGYIPIIVFLIVLIPAHRALKRATMEQQAKEAALLQNPVLWVEKQNKDIFILSLAPIILGRVALLTGALLHALPVVGGALLVLLLAKPYRELFTIPCKRCGFPTSRALQKLHRCPKCAFEFFYPRTL